MAILRILIGAALLVASLQVKAACLIDKFQPAGADWIGEDVAISDKFFAFSASASDEVFIYRQKPAGGYRMKKLAGFEFITELEIFDKLLIATGASDQVKIVDLRNRFAVQTVTVPEPTSSYLRHDVMVIGSAYVDDPGGFANGMATIFRQVSGSWVQEAVIQNSDNNDFDIFGKKVFIHPDGRVLVGAIGARTNNIRVGAVYEFTDTGGLWVETRKNTWILDELDFYGNDFEVTPDGLNLAVAAVGREAVFTSDFAGLLVQEHNISESFTEFGDSLAVNNKYMVVGAPYGGNDDVGEVHLYEFDGSIWFEIGTITSPDGFPIDEFGRSVDISENNLILVGAPLHPNEFGPGAVYLYDVNDCP